MRNYLQYLAFFFIPVFFFEAQAPLLDPVKKNILPLKPTSEEFIDWSADRPLTWDDYRGRPDPESDAAASTTTYLGIEYNIRSNQFSYKIHSRFSCDKSWGLHKTAYILSHEQGHFDIAEIYARILNKRMSEYQFDRRTYSKDLKKIYEEVVEEKEEMQHRYDKETNHSIYRVKQEEWLEKIKQMLLDTEAYSDY